MSCNLKLSTVRIKSMDEFKEYLNTGYHVSPDGRVIGPRKKILSPSLNNKGYLGIGISIKGKVTRKMIHRIVAETFLPNPNNYPVVNHIDGNILNNDIDNLEWCTQSHNLKHGFKRRLSF